MVNIKDIGDIEIPSLEAPNSCRLVHIFLRQKELLNKYHPIEAKNGFHTKVTGRVDLNDKFHQHMLKDYAWRITEELGEAMNTLKNKPWKQTQMVTDEAHYKEEIIDAFHFMIELCILSGMDYQEVFEVYFQKAAVNGFRQESGY